MKPEKTNQAELLSFGQIQARVDASPVAYIPIGAIEFHGSHLPIGLDGLIAHSICSAAASETGGIVLPTIYHGTGGEHSDYPWTIMLPTSAALSTVLDVTLSRLQDLGVKRAVVLSGHSAIEQKNFLEELDLSWGLSKSHSMRVTAVTVADCPAVPIHPDHAGAFESLLLAATNPELVRLDTLPPIAEDDRAILEENPFGAHRHSEDHPLWGIFGPDPRSVNLEEGKDLFDLLARWVASLAREGLR